MATPFTMPSAILTTLLLPLGSSVVSAQTMAQEDLLPPIGATWHMRALQVMPPLSADDHPMVWPFTSVVGSDLFGASFTMLAPAQVAGSAAFPAVDRVLRMVPDQDAPIWNTYLDVQAERCVELASTSALIERVYHPPALVTTYPLAFHTPVVEEHCFVAVSASSLTPYCGTAEVVFLHKGILQLGFGEFPHAQLVRQRRTAVNAANASDSTMSETLTWYSPGIPYPLLQLTTVHYADGTQAWSGYILDPSSVVAVAEDQAVADLRVYPVPSTGEVFLHTAEGGRLEIFSADGRLVRTVRLAKAASPVAMDLSDLPAGTYQVMLHTASAVRRSALILAR